MIGRSSFCILALALACMATSAKADPINLPGLTAPSSPPAKALKRTEILYFDDWSVICQEFADSSNKQSCSAQLQAQQTETNRTVLVWTVKIDAQKVTASLQTLTGVLLAPGVELRPESSEMLKFSYESCEPTRCIATATLDEKFQHDAAMASKATVTVHGVAGNAIRLDISMKGFDRAVAQLKANGK